MYSLCTVLCTVCVQSVYSLVHSLCTVCVQICVQAVCSLVYSLCTLCVQYCIQSVYSLCTVCVQSYEQSVYSLANKCARQPPLAAAHCIDGYFPSRAEYCFRWHKTIIPCIKIERNYFHHWGGGQIQQKSMFKMRKKKIPLALMRHVTYHN